MNIIECKNLTKEYLSGENVVKAVDDVTVSFEQGEFCAITGPSGSGKSTFLHVLSSLENLYETLNIIYFIFITNTNNFHNIPSLYKYILFILILI